MENLLNTHAELRIQEQMEENHELAQECNISDYDYFVTGLEDGDHEFFYCFAKTSPDGEILKHFDVTVFISQLKQTAREISNNLNI